MKYLSIDLELKSYSGRGDALQLKGQDVFFYGAHNIDGVRSLAKKLTQESHSQTYKTYRYIIGFSSRKEEDILTMIQITAQLMPSPKELIFCSYPHERSWWPTAGSDLLLADRTIHLLEKLKEKNFQFDYRFCQTPGNIFESKQESPFKIKTVVFGSFFFVAYCKQLLAGQS